MNDLFVLVFNFVSPLTNAVRQKQKRQKAEEKNSFYLSDISKSECKDNKTKRKLNSIMA
jgi:hypothetical protein